MVVITHIVRTQESATRLQAVWRGHAMLVKLRRALGQNRQKVQEAIMLRQKSVQRSSTADTSTAAERRERSFVNPISRQHRQKWGTMANTIRTSSDLIVGAKVNLAQDAVEHSESVTEVAAQSELRRLPYWVQVCAHLPLPSSLHALHFLRLLWTSAPALGFTRFASCLMPLVAALGEIGLMPHASCLMPHAACLMPLVATPRCAALSVLCCAALGSTGLGWTALRYTLQLRRCATV